MSFVGGRFKHDIFVTYSHGPQDSCGRGVMVEWSRRFVVQLDIQMLNHTKYSSTEYSRHKIFHDADDRQGRGVDPTFPLTDQLKQNVAESAILLVLMTPEYLKSDWCRREREWWAEAQNELGVPIAGRCFLSRVKFVDLKKQDMPKHLSDDWGEPHTGFCFHPQGSSTPYLWPYPTPGNRTGGSPTALAFNEEIERLATKLWGRLDELRQANQAADTSRKSKPFGQKLYLFGRDTDAFNTVRKRLVQDLHDVNPLEAQLTEKDSKILLYQEKQRISNISKCDALLLVGTNDTEALKRDLRALAKVECPEAEARRVIHERRNDRLKFAVVDTEGVAQTHPSVRQEAQDLRVDWVDATTEAWPDNVGKWLQGGAAA